MSENSDYIISHSMKVNNFKDKKKDKLLLEI